jgi:chromosome condensin MukBEF MukE localization factor
LRKERILESEKSENTGTRINILVASGGSTKKIQYLSDSAQNHCQRLRMLTKIAWKTGDLHELAVVAVFWQNADVRSGTDVSRLY